MRRTSWRTKSCCDEPERDLAAHTGRRPRTLMRIAPVDASRRPRQAVDVGLPWHASVRRGGVHLKQHLD
eukprot:16397543-Heterocapsa_arctica.AAC.1